MCKNSNVFSLPVLIRREAWPPFFFKTVRQDGSQEKRQARHISTIIQQIRQQTLYLQHYSSPRFSSFFLIYFFPVSIAGLKLTFPSRTRSIRGLTTMVLHNRVWESSSMPGFFFLDLVLFFRVQGLFFTILRPWFAWVVWIVQTPVNLSRNWTAVWKFAIMKLKSWWKMLLCVIGEVSGSN